MTSKCNEMCLKAYLSIAKSLQGGLVAQSVFSRLHHQSQTRVDALL